MEENQKPVWREWLESFIVIGLLAFVIRSFIVAPFKIPSSSMVPTLEVGDYLFVLRYSYGLRIPFTDLQFVPGPAKHGDIVVFDYPEDRDKDFIKRVVGVPGDHVVYRDNRLSVNGQEMPLQQIAPYPYYLGDGSVQVSMEFEEKLYDVSHRVLRQPYTLRDGEWTVPAGQYMVLGDNRNNSRDSRFWGFVPQEYLVGKAAIVWWSWDQVKGTVRWDRLGTILH